jgi:hypothetical protein
VIALSFFPEITCMLLVEKINTVPDPTMIPATLFSTSEAATRTQMGTEGNFKPRLGSDNSFVILVDVYPPPQIFDMHLDS